MPLSTRLEGVKNDASARPPNLTAAKTVTFDLLFPPPEVDRLCPSPGDYLWKLFHSFSKYSVYNLVTDERTDGWMNSIRLSWTVTEVITLQIWRYWKIRKNSTYFSSWGTSRRRLPPHGIHFCRTMLCKRGLCRHVMSVRLSLGVNSVKTNKHIIISL